MKRVVLLLVMIMTIMSLSSCVAESCKREKRLSLSKVPKKVMQAAQQSIVGIKIIEAEVEQTRRGLVYELEGIADGKLYEVKVSAKGKVLNVQREGVDDDNGDDDHHNDGDDDDDDDDDDDGDGDDDDDDD